MNSICIFQWQPLYAPFCFLDLDVYFEIQDGIVLHWPPSGSASHPVGLLDHSRLLPSIVRRDRLIVIPGLY